MGDDQEVNIYKIISTFLLVLHPSFQTFAIISGTAAERNGRKVLELSSILRLSQNLFNYLIEFSAAFLNINTEQKFDGSHFTPRKLSLYSKKETPRKCNIRIKVTQ